MRIQCWYMLRQMVCAGVPLCIQHHITSPHCELQLHRFVYMRRFLEESKLSGVWNCHERESAGVTALCVNCAYARQEEIDKWTVGCLQVLAPSESL
jgi:hypothetical protein